MKIVKYGPKGKDGYTKYNWINAWKWLRITDKK